MAAEVRVELSGVIADWDNDGLFESTESMDGDVLSLIWNRGSEPEQETTPSGSLTIQVADPNGDYIPDSTHSGKFGANNVKSGRSVVARVSHGGTTYSVFRGVIERISTKKDAAGFQSATLFCLDETEELSRTSISFPLSEGSGDVGLNTSGRPIKGVTAGGSTGVIAQILNASSFSSTRRALSEPGASTFDNWWQYETFARNALNEVEEHERGRVFMNGVGNIVFHSSTHTQGSTNLATFNANFDNLSFSQSNRDVINRTLVTVHDREQSLSGGVLGAANPSNLPSIGNGSVFTTRIIFETFPVDAVIVPLAEADSTRGISAVGAGGTSYTGANVTVAGTWLGASALRLKISNNSGETITIQVPELATDTSQAIPIEGTRLSDNKMTTTDQSISSIGIYGPRMSSFDYPFFANLNKGVNRATDIVNEQSTAHAQGIRLLLSGSDSDLITQMLTRELDDRIAVNSTAFKFSNRPFYITAGEWELEQGHLITTFTLGDAT